MLPNYPDRKMTAHEWKYLRGESRKHALINSRLASEKRMLLKDQEVFMGGMVVEKRSMAVVLHNENNDAYQVRCALPLDQAQIEMQKAIAEGRHAVLEGSGVDFMIYDFSGVFKVNGSLGSFDRDLRKKMYRVKEGELVFILGQLIPMNDSFGYHILPQDFYSLDEVGFYREVFRDQYAERKNAVQKIKEHNRSESVNDRLCFPRDPWEVIRLFLQPQHGLQGNDYFALESAANDIFDKTQDVRAAKLVLKYYLQHVLEEKAQFESETLQDYSVDIKELFFDLYPHLQGVVSWPQELSND